MKKVRSLAALVFFLFLLFITGCVTTPIDWNNQQQFARAEGTKVEHDNLKNITMFSGPYYKVSYDNFIYLRAWKNDISSETTYQIYVRAGYYGDWRNYNSAYDSNGNQMDFQYISKDVDVCSGTSSQCNHVEHVGINVTRSYLEKHIKSGLSFKVSGTTPGEQIYMLPGGYIDSFLRMAQ